MNVLLDTHTFLWFISGNPKLRITARTLIEAPTSVRLLSIASVWEMAIKVSTGRLAFSTPFNEFISTQMHRNAIDLFSITIAHTYAVSTLPYHHRDPFDRLIIAQAIVESLPVIGIDSVFDDYSIARLW